MYEGPVQNLIDEFGKLPGIGPKSAQRLAFHLLQAEPESVERLRSALQAVAFWLLGHYKYGLERGYWKSRVAYQLWPLRGGARWYRAQSRLASRAGI